VSGPRWYAEFRLKTLVNILPLVVVPMVYGLLAAWVFERVRRWRLRRQQRNGAAR